VHAQTLLPACTYRCGVVGVGYSMAMVVAKVGTWITQGMHCLVGESEGEAGQDGAMHA